MKTRLFLWTLILLGFVCSSFSKEDSLFLAVSHPHYSQPLQLAYTTSSQSHELTPIDLRTGINGTPILLQDQPQIMVISPDGQFAYISYKESPQIACVKLATKALDHTITLEGIPSHLSLAPDGQTLYVTYAGSNQIFSIDIASQHIQPCILMAEPAHALSLSPDGKKLYAIQPDLSTVNCFDIQTHEPHLTFNSSNKANTLVAASDNQTAYIASSDSQQIHRLHLANYQCLSSLTLNKKPRDISINRDNTRAYVTHENSREILPIDLTTFQAETPLILEKNVEQIVLHPKQEELISFQVQPAPVGQPSLFDASMIKPFRDSIHHYAWDFGDSHTALSKEPFMTHTYQSSGSFYPTLVVTERIEKIAPQIEESELLDKIIGLQMTAKQVIQIKEASHLDESTDKPSLQKLSNDKALLSSLALSPTTTTLNSSANPSVFGQSITLIATVISVDSRTPTGIVTFKEGTTSIGVGTLNGNGQTILSISNLTMGTHLLTAVYGGDVNFDTSISSAFSQVVNQANTSTSVTSSINPSTYRQSITLTATVTVASPGAGMPAGTVTFKDGTNTIGTSTLNGSGVATLATSTLTAGSHSITAVYNGNTHFLTSTSPVFTQTVDKSATTTTLTSSLNPSSYGQSIILSAKVSAMSPGAGIPTGTVTFMDGTTNLGIGTLNGSGVATLTTAILVAGTHSLTAVYTGNTNYLTSTSSALNQIINPATPIITISSSLNPCNFGSLVTFTSTVNSPTNVGLPTGTVTFIEGTTSLGTVTLIATGANTSTAAFAIANLTGGSHSIKAVYSGDSNFVLVTSSALNQVVNPVSTTTTLFSISPNPTEFGETVMLQALITGSVSTPPAVPSGNIQFYDGTTLIGTASANSQSSNTSLAILSVSNLAIGAHALKAVYSGDINYIDSTSSLMTQNVIQGGTSINLTNPANPSVFGQAITWTATVTPDVPAAGNPTGPVEFYDGVDLLGVSTLTPSGTNTSIATFATSGLTLGSHTILAIYPGDSNFTSAVSNLFKQTVNQDQTTTALTSSLNPSNFGDSVTFSAIITANAPGSGVPTGQVSFYENSTRIGKGTLDGSGVATFSTIALYPSTHTIKAIYEGDTNFITSTSSPLAQTVMNQLPTLTTVSSGRNSSPTEQSVTFSAKVTAITGIPTGTVAFYDGTTLIGTGTLNSKGVATITENGADLTTFGSHPITAIYSGDANFISSTSAQFDQYVVPYDTSTVLSVIPNPSQQANSILVAIVTPTGTPTPIPPLKGTVTFYQGSLLLQTVAVDPLTGVASWEPNNLHFNSSTVFAIYSGNQTDFATSTSNSITLQVQQTDMLTTETTVLSSPPKAYFCQPVTLHARVVATQGFYSPTGSVTFFSDGVEIGTTLLTPNSSPANSSQASLTLSNLDIGSHIISATYNSDSNYAFSLSSNTVTKTIIPNTTTTTLNLIPNLTTTPFGDPLIFIAQVSSLYSTATGSVTFSDGSTPLATIDLDETGEASLTISSLNVGLHTVTVTYNPDACFFSSSAELIHTINKAKAATYLAIAPSSSTYGQEVTLTARVSAIVGTPTGTITFYNGTTVLGTANLINGTASLTTVHLPVGTSLLKAIYSGDASFISSNLPSAIHTVSKATPIACLLSYTPTPTDFGQPIIFSATVSSDVGQPSGTVTFKNGTTVLGTSTLDHCGVATLQVSNLNISSHIITADYNGDAKFTTATSNTLTSVITQADTVTNVVVTTPASGSSTFGSSVTFRATVAALNPGSGTPTGNVAFYYGSTLLGTPTLANGTASLSTTTLPVGVQTVTAKYAGNINFTASTGSVTQTVTKVTPILTVISNSNPSTYGQVITFTANATSSVGVPTGVVTFLDNTTTVIGIGSLNNGQATFTLSTLSVGSHSITVRYSGDANFNTSTSTTALAQTVNPITTNTVLISETSSSVFGEPVTLLANVTSTAGIPTGTVTFKEGDNTIGIVSLNNGQAILTTTSLSIDQHSITASYTGNSTFSSSTSAALTQTVNQTSTLINAITSPNPSSLNESISFHVTVSPINTIVTSLPSGTITVHHGSTLIGTGTLNNTGVVTFSSTVNLPAGTHTLIINYLGDANFVASSIAVTQTISQATSTITLASTPNPSIFNQPVNFTATVSPTSATGTVTFSDETGVLGIVSIVNGQANLSLSTLLPGSHTVVATYNGDTSFTSAISASITQSVNQIVTTISLISSMNPVVFGDAVTFTASVNPNPGNTTGAVSFFDGSTLLGFVPISNGAATFTTSSLLLGSHSITATYTGDTHFLFSTSNTVTQSVSMATTTASLISNINPSSYGQNVTFVATISTDSPASGSPTGTVTFYDGTTTLGFSNLDTNSQALLTVSNLTAGSHNIVVTYAGDANFLDSSATLSTQIVETIHTTTTLTTSILNPSIFGQTVNLFANVTSITGSPTGIVDFYEGTALIGSASLQDGLAIYPIQTLAIGSHAIHAVYKGDNNFDSSTSFILTQVVNANTIAETSITTLTSHLNPSNFSDLVTLTVTVTPFGGSNVPTGVVSLYNGALPLATLILNAGQATYQTANLPAGHLEVVAFYSGDSNFSASTTVLTQTVNKINTYTDLSSSSSLPAYGEPCTFTAYVTSPSIGVIPTGTVTFYDESAILSTVILDGTGRASFTTSSLTSNRHSITAIYNPDPNYKDSNASLNQQVAAGQTSTLILTSTPNPSSQGEAVIFTAAVTSTVGMPTGTVTFYDGPTLLGATTLYGGLALFTVQTLSSGSHTITAVYNGKDNFAASSSGPYIQAIQAPLAVTTLQLASSLNPSEFGQFVNFTASLSSSLGLPIGTVTFYDRSTSIGTVILDENGFATLSLANLAIGEHFITATYSGDKSYQTSLSNSLLQIINPSTLSEAPQNIQGHQVVNKFATKMDRINIITWDPPSCGVPPVSYKIYRNSQLTHLAGEVPVQNPLIFEDHYRKKNRSYTYYIVSVNQYGKTSLYASVKVKGKS